MTMKTGSETHPRSRNDFGRLNYSHGRMSVVVGAEYCRENGMRGMVTENQKSHERTVFFPTVSFLHCEYHVLLSVSYL